MTLRAIPIVRPGRLALIVSLLASLLLALPSLAADQQTFATPEAAVEALTAALKANDEAALIAMMGDKYRSLVVSGDVAYDAAQRAELAARLSTFKALDDSG